jgi:hypothetical protein
VQLVLSAPAVPRWTLRTIYLVTRRSLTSFAIERLKLTRCTVNLQAIGASIALARKRFIAHF